MIDAHRARRDPQVGGAERVEQIGPHGTLRLGAQPQHVGRRVVALERGQVHAGDGAQQPGGLPFLLDGASGRDGGGAALHGAAVDVQGADEIQVEGNARIAPGLGEHP